jgi:hypothetical protein
MATFLDIHDEAVQSFIREGGAVHALLNDVAKDTRDYAVTYISTKGHVRSGRLLRGQFWNRAKLEGPLQGVARAGSSARHSVWFHDGTGSVISHPNMLIPRDRRAAMTSTAFTRPVGTPGCSPPHRAGRARRICRHRCHPRN